MQRRILTPKTTIAASMHIIDATVNTIVLNADIDAALHCGLQRARLPAIDIENRALAVGRLW